MNVINFNEKICEKIREYFDAYVDNELLVETDLQVLQHLESCDRCKRVLDERIRLKRAVQRVVEQQQVPDTLVTSVQNAIRGAGRRRFLATQVRRWPVIAAATLVLSTGLVILRVNSPVTGTDAFQQISEQAREIMRVGLIDHIHCALLAKKWQHPHTLEAMQQATGRTALGPEFIGLVSLVTGKTGSSFHMIQGHRCFVKARQYVHVILTDRDNRILSLVITEKSGEELARANVPSTPQDGVAVYRTVQGQLQVAAFETNRYLAFVISNLDQNGNLRVASDLAEPVYNFLRRLDI